MVHRDDIDFTVTVMIILFDYFVAEIFKKIESQVFAVAAGRAPIPIFFSHPINPIEMMQKIINKTQIL